MSLISRLVIGQEVEIIYHGGSQPGTRRQVVPVEVRGQYLRARDVTGGRRVKQFLIEKIEIPEPETVAVDYRPGLKVEQPEPASIREAISPYIQELERQGWHVMVADDGVGLFARFKNGSLRKTPDLELLYVPEVYDYYWDENKGEEVEESRPSKRPWHTGTSSFSKLSKAMARFLLLAAESRKKSGTTIE